jgi:hypothetical protein
MARIINQDYINTECDIINDYNQSSYDEETVFRIIERVRSMQRERSIIVNTEDYMQLPPADDESIGNDSEAEESSSDTESDEDSDNEAEEEESEEEESEEAMQENCMCMLQEECQTITGKPVYSLPENTSLGECAICLESIDQLVNITNTRCGHSFHTSCLLRAITCGAGNCPNCRSLLVVKEEKEEDDEYWTEVEDDEDDEYDEDDEDDEEEEIQVATLEQTAAKLQNLGYSVADILSLYIGNEVKSETPDRYKEEFFRKMMNDLDGIIDGRIPLSQRDTRSYLDVAQSSRT